MSDSDYDEYAHIDSEITPITKKFRNENIKSLSYAQLTVYWGKLNEEYDEIWKIYVRCDNTVEDAMSVVEMELGDRICSYYNLPCLNVVTSEYQFINGYKLMNSDNYFNHFKHFGPSGSFCSYTYGQEVIKNSKEYTKEQFIEELKRYKKNESYQLNTSFEELCEQLWILPYCKELMLTLANNDIRNYENTVRYCNWYCHTLQLKKQKLDDYITDVIDILSIKACKDLAIYIVSFLESHKI
jgi:hypothetical protein